VTDAHEKLETKHWQLTI